MSQAPGAVFKPVYKHNRLIDIECAVNDRRFSLLGPGGSERELAPVRDFLAKDNGKLPVLLGAGLGHALKLLLSQYDGPVAIVDAESELEKITHVLAGLAPGQAERVLIINSGTSDEVLARLTRWQTLHGSRPLAPLVNTFYLRLNREWYGAIRDSLAASSRYDFWGKAKKPRFQDQKPRLLLLASKYFLIGEIESACKKLDLPCRLVFVGDDVQDGQEFVKRLLKECVDFQPDCMLTLNHMGVDREGVLMDLLARLELPLASWFVDNPHLIIHNYRKCISPWTTLFTWDEDNIASLKEFGFEHVHYLPLGTDPDRFRPGLAGRREWKADVSFVGNSMLYKVGARLKAGKFPKALLLAYKSLAASFAQSNERSVADFMARTFPGIYQLFLQLPDNEARLAYETAITWQATRLYRNDCVARILPFKPLIVGDNGWKIEFRRQSSQPRFLDPIAYYTDLPAFYGMSRINFNCTSKQMKGAVNQRIFDAPAAGGFVLTDWRPQIANLFEADEMACYQEPGEIPELCDYYLKNPQIAEKITRKARRRVLATHKWEDRLVAMLAKMRQIYGTA